MKLQTLLGHCLKKVMAFDYCNNSLKSYLMHGRTSGCFHICSLPESGFKKLFLIFHTVFAMCFLSVGVDATGIGFEMETPADYLISLVRHGDRSPRDLGDMAQYWPMGPGQLTAGGLEQEYLLGKKIRQHYFSESLPDSWSPKISQHYAKGLDRTIQSASALLQGVYPGQPRNTGLPGGIQVPPVYASPLASDDLFSAQRLCPGYLHRVQALEKSADWLRKKEQYRDQLSSWFELSEGSGAGDLYSLIPLIDQISIHRMHRRPMPKGITIQEAIELEELLNWVVSRIIANYEIAQLIGAPLAKAMIRDFKRVQQCLEDKGSCNSCQRWTLYSASDSNLLAIMTMLGAPSDRIVDYATHFGVQLNWNEGRPEIALSLNHEPFSVPGCVGHCSLDQWLVLLEQSLPDDWDYLCARDRGGFAPYPEPYVPSGSVASR
ncbi:histidine phosphatase family protein [Endozoicomonas elysicola]|uniref:Acid phosphatase n=1 Tax=Endozoicomonas elysicola TaxID=305900 RepID=A0A081K7T3_9GAMM|nr:histidine phosphatase family protein [Endozoicomonas elysicola]KEI70209.1 hypothetical protein GV64_05135 [Endozoicomonas elysicola]